MVALRCYTTQLVKRSTSFSILWRFQRRRVSWDCRYCTQLHPVTADSPFQYSRLSTPLPSLVQDSEKLKTNTWLRGGGGVRSAAVK